jgi:hypothetical protein
LFAVSVLFSRVISGNFFKQTSEELVGKLGDNFERRGMDKDTRQRKSFTSQARLSLGRDGNIMAAALTSFCSTMKLLV